MGHFLRVRVRSRRQGSQCAAEDQLRGRHARVLPRPSARPLLAGRDFDDHDSEDGEPVVIISQTLARRIRAAGFAALGSRLRHGLNFDHWSKVVGVASDARYRNITQSGADIFVPSSQAAQPTNYLMIRGKQSATDIAALVRRSLAEIDPNQAVAGVATIGQLIDANAARHRFNMMLLLWFGVCAAILAAAGVYSVIAEAMAARKLEIAIRTALGARRPRLVRDMVSRTLVFVLIGELLGGCMVAASGSIGSELLYGVSAKDPWVLGFVAAFLFAASLGPLLAGVEGCRRKRLLYDQKLVVLGTDDRFLSSVSEGLRPAKSHEKLVFRCGAGCQPNATRFSGMGSFCEGTGQIAGLFAGDRL